MYTVVTCGMIGVGASVIGALGDISWPSAIALIALGAIVPFILLMRPRD